MVEKETQVKDVRATNSSFFLSHLTTNTPKKVKSRIRLNKKMYVRIRKPSNQFV